MRVTAADAANDLGRLLGRYKVGATVAVHAFRRDELKQFKVKLQSDDVPAWSLKLAEVESKAKTKSVKKSTLTRPSAAK